MEVESPFCRELKQDFWWVQIIHVEISLKGGPDLKNSRVFSWLSTAPCMALPHSREILWATGEANPRRVAAKPSHADLSHFRNHSEYENLSTCCTAAPPIQLLLFWILPHRCAGLDHLHLSPHRSNDRPTAVRDKWLLMVVLRNASMIRHRSDSCAWPLGFDFETSFSRLLKSFLSISRLSLFFNFCACCNIDDLATFCCAYRTPPPDAYASECKCCEPLWFGIPDCGGHLFLHRGCGEVTPWGPWPWWLNNDTNIARLNWKYWLACLSKLKSDWH